MGTIRTPLVGSIACSAFILAQYAFADVDYLDMSLEQLLQVQVHGASKRDELIGNAPAAVYAVTSADIERSGVTNIPDALRMVPGVQVARSDSNSWTISIRGFNGILSNKLLVMIDGRTIYNPIFGGTFWEAHNVMMENIDRIEVIRGPGGALWGSNAVNGVINIITKHSNNTQGNLVTAHAGNEEKGTLGARHGGSFGSIGSFRVYAKAFQQDQSARPQVENPGTDEDTYDKWDGFRTGFRVDWGDELMIHGNAYRTNTQQRRVRHLFAPPFASIEDQTIVYEGINLLGQWNRIYDDGAKLSVQSYVDWTKRDEPFNFIDERTTLDLEIQYDFTPTDRHEIIAGVGYRSLFEDRPGYGTTSFEPQKETRHVYHVFAQDKITLVPDSWFLTLGAKVEHNEFTATEIQPNARLQWHLNESSMLWTSISSAARQPTPIETQLTSIVAISEGQRISFIPNSEFEAEKVIAYELGYRNQVTESFSIDIASFYNEYERLTTFTLDDPVLIDNGVDAPYTLIPVRFTNNMEGYTRGLEVIVGWQMHQNLFAAMDYSYLKMSLNAPEADHQSAQGLSPRHQLGTRAYWDIREDWMLGVSAKYVDKLPANDVDSYVRLDINISKQLGDSLKFNLVGQNLLKSSQREFGTPSAINTGEIERSVFAKLTWQF